MSTLLGRVQARNETWFTKLPPKNTRIRGVAQPIDPDRLPTTSFILPRTSLRVREREPIELRDLLRDSVGRILLVAEHDMGARVFALFQMSQRVLWQRRESTVNPVTGLASGKQTQTDLGMVWVTIETQGTGSRDGGTRVGLNPRRCITGAELQLGDVIAGQTVKHLNLTLGVTIAEIE